jgi:hypothetical protein
MQNFEFAITVEQLTGKVIKYFDVAVKLAAKHCKVKSSGFRNFSKENVSGAIGFPGGCKLKTRTPS